MEKLTTLTGVAVPLRRSNVDTDQIIPAVFLKRVKKSGFDDALFYAWRRDPEFVLNKPEYKQGKILVAGLVVGRQADFVVLDAEHVALAGLPADSAHASHVFASHRTSAIADVWVNGHLRVSQGRHNGHEAAKQAFTKARSQLLRAA